MRPEQKENKRKWHLKSYNFSKILRILERSKQRNRAGEDTENIRNKMGQFPETTDQTMPIYLTLIKKHQKVKYVKISFLMQPLYNTYTTNR